MIHTSSAIITATLTFSAAVSILAAPVEPRIYSGFSSLDNRAPVPPPPTQPPAMEPKAVPAPASAPKAAAKETSSSGFGPASAVVGGGTPATALNGLPNPTSRAIDGETYVAARAGLAPEETSAGTGKTESLSESLASPITKATSTTITKFLLDHMHRRIIHDENYLAAPALLGRDLEGLIARSFGIELD